MPRTGDQEAPAVTGDHSGGVLARNTLLNLGGLGLPLVVAVFAMPPVVAGLGTDRFGILALVWVVLGYMALLDLGLGRATTKFAAEALAQGDPRRISSSARVAAGVQVVLGIAGGVGLALAVPFLIERFLNVDPGLQGEARRSFYFLAAVTPVLLVTNTFRGLLEAGQRFDLVNAVRLPVSTANFLLPLVGVLLGWTLPGIVAAVMAMRVAALAAYGGFAVRQYPQILRPVSAEPGEIRALLGFGGWLTVSSLVSPLLVYLDRFVIGNAFSMAAVGYYSAPHELVMRLTLLPASLVATLFPALSAGSHLGEDERVGQLVAGAVKFLLITAGPILLTLAVLAPEVLELWLGGSFARESGVVLRFLAIGMLVNALAYVPNVLLQAAGRPDLPAKFHLAELPIHVAVLWLFTGRWGLAGAAAAWTLRVVLDAGLLFATCGRLRLLSWAGFRRRRIPGALALLVVLAAVLVAVDLTVSPMAGRFGAAALVVAAGAGAFWVGLLDPTEREELRQLARRGA